MLLISFIKLSIKGTFSIILDKDKVSLLKDGINLIPAAKKIPIFTKIVSMDVSKLKKIISNIDKLKINISSKINLGKIPNIEALISVSEISLLFFLNLFKKKSDLL